MQTPETVLYFWFHELSPEQLFNGGSEVDQLITERFRDLHLQATRGELDNWRTTIQGRLAEIILLDQFSRNIYRGKPESFAFDLAALTLSQEALKTGQTHLLTAEELGFLLMPFMHSESKKIHQAALQLFNQPGLENFLEYEQQHKKIIDRFERYPHRNAILGRESTNEEKKFLTEPGSSF
ncbi:DUF924 family protein [Tetragenococcus solitarius]|uniref:DUF924 family protein n=1 Tax=Tetragenococcus solitarius TaxID=71453 RepID=A0ABP6KPC5_9ENTE|nr:DUF924 family protein [Tetragenococcus solitarius]